MGTNTCRAWQEMKNENFNKGLEQGRQQGLEQVAVNMILENMDDTLIQKLTGLSAERIAELRDQKK